MASYIRDLRSDQLSEVERIIDKLQHNLVSGSSPIVHDKNKTIARLWYYQAMPGPNGRPQRPGIINNYLSAGSGDIMGLVGYICTVLKEVGSPERAKTLAKYYSIDHDPKSGPEALN